MRKKWTYVAIVSMMLGVAPVFTGCVDTDEPAGLENLRGAKADLLRAKAAVQEALAKVEEANARYRDQETAWLKAKTDYETQVAREKELQNDLLEAQNEFEKQKAEAAYQAYLEELARQKELLDAQLAADLKQAEADMMQAEINLEALRQELELAKISGTEATQATIAALQADVEAAYVKIPGSGWWEPSTTEDKPVIGAIQEYYFAKKAEQEALAYQNQGFDCRIEKNEETGVITVTVTSGTHDWAGTLAYYVEKAQGELEAAQKLLTDLETYGDKEVEGTDWKAEVAKLEAEIEKLEQDLSVQLAQLEQAHATPEYLAAEQAVNGVWKNVGKDEPTGKNEFGEDYKKGDNYREVQVDLGDGNTEKQYEVLVEKGAIQILNSAKNKLMAAQKNANDYTFSYEAYQAATPVTDVMKTAIEDAVDALNSKLPTTADPADRYQTPDWEIGFAYEAKDKFDWGTKTGSTGEVPATRADEPDEVKAVMDDLNDWIAMVDEATIDPNEVGNAEAMMTRAKATQEAAQKTYDAAKLVWTDLVDIITNEKAYPVPTTDFTKSTTAYSTAFTKLQTAINNWNTGIEKAYDDAEEKVNADRRLDLMDGLLNDNYNVDFSVPAEFDVAVFNASWDPFRTSPTRKTEEEFNRALVDGFGDAENAASLATNLLAQLRSTANNLIGLNFDQRNAEAEAAAEAAASDYVTDKNLKDINDAKAAIEDAVWDGTSSGGTTIASLNVAIGNFNKLAETYVQLPADEKKQAIHVLIAVPNNKGETSGFASRDESEYFTYADDAEGKRKYTIKVTDITSTEIDDATKTKYNAGVNSLTGETYAHEALLAKSKEVFGIDEVRWTEPSRETIEDALAAKLEEAGDDVTNPDYVAYKNMYDKSYAGFKFKADDAVKNLQDRIDASDDLKALYEELVAAQAAFKKSIDDQYTANFGELETALAAANTDLAAKQDALDEQEAKFNDIDVAIAKLQAQIAAENELLETLQSAAWKYLNITWPGSIPTWTEENKLYDPEKFAEDLQNAIEAQKLEVAEKERLVALAQAEYDKAAATGYNGVDLATLYVEAASAKRKTAEEAYTRALEALQRALDVLSGSEAEQPEQPAE